MKTEFIFITLDELSVSLSMPDDDVWENIDIYKEEKKQCICNVDLCSIEEEEKQIKFLRRIFIIIRHK